MIPGNGPGCASARVVKPARVSRAGPLSGYGGIRECGMRHPGPEPVPLCHRIPLCVRPRESKSQRCHANIGR